MKGIRHVRDAAVLALLPITLATELAAQAVGDSVAVRDSVARYTLVPLVVNGRSDDLTKLARSASQGFVGMRDFKLRPLMREGELLETVPGLVMTQHSGDGKSNQMFVRGFNLDHGTDFSTTLEGVPVNLPTHAHGQGYTDLNFIIPELLDHVEYRLGPYYAEIGDFGSAGGAELRLRRALEEPLVVAGVGEGGYRRVVGAASQELAGGVVLGGAELKGYDGPWDRAQALRKVSGLLRYTRHRSASTLSVLALGYDNRWNASDQLPERLVQAGRLGRFGQVDTTLGGETSRYLLAAAWTRSAAATAQRAQLYAMRYDLDLYSNFTYYLDDPARGDQIRQRDRGRTVVGGEYVHSRGLARHVLRAGVQGRADWIDVALERTVARLPYETVRHDDVRELNTGAWLEARTDWTPRLRSTVGLRGDVFHFRVRGDAAANSGTATDAILSPKATLAFEAAPGTELYLGAGYGFHSNDARGTVQTFDPGTGEAVDAVDPLVRSRGAEAGVRTMPVAGWHSTLTAWTVDLDSELLFVGDAGTTEPSHASRRLGLTWTNFWRASDALRLDFDASLARARFRGLPRGEIRVPGALENVITAGGAWEPALSGPYVALRLRHFGEYALVEDDSRRARATTLVNGNLGWRFGALRLGASVMNLFDAAHADITYLYASRIAGEPAGGIEDVHFHAVEPRQLRFTVSWGY